MKNEDDYIKSYLSGVCSIAKAINRGAVEDMVKIIRGVRKKDGRIFMLGVGGGAANASHAVNDFRKITGIECYSATENVGELTARINDEGWETVFAKWLKTSRLNKNDAIFVFSVGGGNAQKNVSINIIHALKYAKAVGAKIIGIVGRDGGVTAQLADACVIVPSVDNATVTAYTESFQAVIWHLIVSHPSLKENEMKWESFK